MAFLIDIGTGTVFTLVGMKIVVGRSEEADVRLTDPSCSRKHFQISLGPTENTVEPLAGHNATWLDGLPLGGPTRLAPGSILQAGNTRLRFQLALKADAPSPQHQETIVAQGQSHGSIEYESPIDLPLGRLTLGRDPSCSIPLQHPQVSRFHAEVISDTSRTILRDLGSENGTFVNGRRLLAGRDAKLAHGDHVDIGPYGLTYSPGRLLPRSRSDNLELIGAGINRTVVDRQTGQPLQLLDDISLIVRPREFVCLLGPSGSGKTTLMGILSGRMKPDTGEVLLNGQNLHAHFEALKKDIAYVPQKDALHDKLTVGEALSFTGLLRLPPDLSPEERRAGIANVLEIVALAHRRGTRISQLSGGQIKRASLANEILNRPSLIFLDEVTSGLDEQTDREMMALFRRVADTGKTIVCITHNLAQVELNCDLIAVLTTGGRTAFIGRPAEALRYFGVQRLGDIYSLLAEQRPEYWQARYRASEYYTTYVAARLQANTVREAAAAQSTKPLAVQAKVTVRQSVLLTLRYLLIWRSSPGALLSMLGQTALVAVLLVLVFGNLAEIGDPDTKAKTTASLTFLLAVSAFWFGCNNAAKEVVKERIIFQRERDYNLLADSYLASKLLVLNGIGLLQVSLLFGIVTFGCEPPGELYLQALLLAALSFAGTCLGLAISAAAGSEEVAIALIPVAVIPQIILSGAITTLSGVPRDIARCAVTTYWGKNGFDQLQDSESLNPMTQTSLLREGSLWESLGVIGLHALVYLALARLFLTWRGRQRV